MLSSGFTGQLLLSCCLQHLLTQSLLPYPTIHPVDLIAMMMGRACLNLVFPPSLKHCQMFAGSPKPGCGCCLKSHVGLGKWLSQEHLMFFQIPTLLAICLLSGNLPVIPALGDTAHYFCLHKHLCTCGIQSHRNTYTCKVFVLSST